MSEFGLEYKKYWERRNQENPDESTQQLVDQQQRTLNNINSMALTSFENYATRVSCH